MKLPQTFFLWSVVALLSGCVGEECVRTIHTINFTYPEFEASISKVHVGLFDENGNAVDNFEMGQSDLANQSANLAISSGKYTIVCWGNADTNTRIGGTSFQDMEVSHPNLGTVYPIPGNDPLYYGSKTFTVQDGQSLNETIPFEPAFIGMNINVRGLTVQTYSTRSSYPLIYIANVRAALGYAMKRIDKFATYYPDVTVTANGDEATASLNLLRFRADDEMEVFICDPNTGNTISSINLPDYIRTNGIEIVDGEEVTIPMYVNITKTNVSITTNAWEEVPISQ